MLKLNKFILYILMSVLLSMGFPNAEDEKAVPPESTLTLEQCIDIARQKNIRLKISESEARQANSEYYLSRSRLNPQLNIAGGYTYLNPLVEVRIPGAPVTLEPMVRHNYSASATLSKLITSFGYLENFISSAREMARAKEFAHRHNVNEILFMVKLRYFKVLNTRGMTKITREQIDLTTDQLKLARNMFDEGILPRLEVLEAELRRSRSRDSLAEAEKNYYSELASFLDLIGINPSRTDIKLVENFIEIEGYNFPNRQEMIEQALELRNDIQSARTLVLAVRKAYYGEMAGNNPQLRAMVKYENKTDTSFTNPEQWTAGVNLEIPIFDGGQTSSRTEIAREKLFQSQKSLEQLENRVKVEVIQAKLELEEAQSRYNSAEYELKTSTENYRLVEARYRNGITNNVELNQATLSLERARINLLNARHRVMTGRTYLEYAMGKNHIPRIEKEEPANTGFEQMKEMVNILDISKDY